ncbi:TraR/DksA family transcriptional regulator [uncultured Amnibacterium sp.]|uniref:TraR/DksA family transcriptional regulator n=1 Tax=uncultured Amnibacterium sp. TaxID=1631851 RepID=UPI0035CBFC2A
MSDAEAGLDPGADQLSRGRDDRAAEAQQRRSVLTALQSETVSTIEVLDRQIERVTAARADANTDDEHDPEGATIAFERSQADALRSAAVSRLTQIDTAIARVDAGTSDRCAVCGDPIPPLRLAARPFATTCLRHA